jgi:hypothetical protein
MNATAVEIGENRGRERFFPAEAGSSVFIKGRNSS